MTDETVQSWNGSETRLGKKKVWWKTGECSRPQQPQQEMNDHQEFCSEWQEQVSPIASVDRRRRRPSRCSVIIWYLLMSRFACMLRHDDDDARWHTCTVRRRQDTRWSQCGTTKNAEQRRLVRTDWRASTETRNHLLIEKLDNISVMAFERRLDENTAMSIKGNAY